MRIEVTQDDIVNGQRRCVTNCPVAIAVRRHTNVQSIWAGRIWIEVDGKRIPTPTSVSEFMRLFDENNHVEPISFELSEPTP